MRKLLESYESNRPRSYETSWGHKWICEVLERGYIERKNVIVARGRLAGIMSDLKRKRDVLSHELRELIAEAANKSGMSEADIELELEDWGRNQG